jgi:hypothetical protein
MGQWRRNLNAKSRKNSRKPKPVIKTDVEYAPLTPKEKKTLGLDKL